VCVRKSGDVLPFLAENAKEKNTEERARIAFFGKTP
jgi:hypothetical protein